MQEESNLKLHRWLAAYGLGDDREPASHDETGAKAVDDCGQQAEQGG